MRTLESMPQGPVSTLPGHRWDAAPGQGDCWFCPEEGPKNPATVILQGETDSFGAEFNLVCKDCADKANKQAREHRSTCEWCGKGNVHVTPTRDPEEGMAGPVYHLCSSCRRAALDCVYE